MDDMQSISKCPKKSLCRNAKDKKQRNCKWNYDNGTCEEFAPERRTDNYEAEGKARSE